MAEFKISTMIIAFLFFVGFTTVGYGLMYRTFTIDPNTDPNIIINKEKIDFYDRVIADINSTDANSALSGELTNTNLGDTLLNKITGGYWGKVIAIKNTFSYISNEFFVMLSEIFTGIVPAEVFYLMIAAFIILILFTIFSLSFYRRV